MGRAGISGNNAHLEGTIKRLVSGKGFGFINAGEDEEYFFHLSDLSVGRFDELKEGEKVRFLPKTTPKGKRAEQVERL